MKDFINSKKGKITLICVLLLIIAAVVLLFVLRGEKGYRSISVSEVVGSVMTENDGKEYEAYQNMRIAGGYALTTDSDSYTRMVLDDDKYVKLEQLSRAKFEELGNDKHRNTIIRLEQGAITNEIAAPLAEDEDYIVNTPNAVLAVRGTFFRVEVRYDVNGDAYTNVYTYGGTVVCRRVMPDGTVVDEEVEITAGYKARIKMDEIITIYIEDRIEEEEDNVDPIELSEITDWDIVDMYNASIHGHELFVDSGELWDEIDDRDIDIDEYTSAYGEEEIEEYPDYQQRTGANNNKNDGNENGNNGNKNGKGDDKNGNKDGNGNKNNDGSDDKNDTDSGNGNEDGNGGNDVGNGDSDNGNKNGNDGNNGNGNDSDDRNDNGNNGNNGNGGNGNHNGWEENDGNDDNVPDDKKSDPSDNENDDSDDRNDNGNNGNNGNGGNGNHNGWEENDNNDKDDSDDKSDNDKSDPSDDKDDSDDKSDNDKSDPSDDKDDSDDKSDNDKSDPSDDKDDSDDKSDNDKSDPSDDKDDSDDKSDNDKSDPSDDKDDSDDKSDNDKSDPSDDKDDSDDKSDNDKSDPSDDKDDSDDKSDNDKSDPSDDKDDSDGNTGGSGNGGSSGGGSSGGGSGNGGSSVFPPAHTHSFGEYVSDNNATCTEDGTKTAVCSCGEKDTVVDEGSAKGHTEKEEVTPATATAEGLRRVYCTVCGETLEKEVLPVTALTLYTEDGNITIRENGYTVSKENNTYVNNNYTGAYLISQRNYDTVAECSITVESGKHDITFDGINIYFNGTAIKVEQGAEITLNSTETENIIANDVSNGFENNGTAAIAGVFTFTDSQDYGIYNTGTLKISGGEIIITGGSSNGVMNEGGSIEISGGKLTVNEWGLYNSENSSVTVSGGELAAKTNFKNNGSIAVNGGSFKVNNGTLYNNGDFTLTNGNVEIKECDSEGIINTGTFNANGGKLVCECENFSIQNENTFTVNGAEVELNIAIWNQGDFTIGSGKFTINTEYEAVTNGKNIYINGGTINIKCDFGIDNLPDAHMEINGGTIEINAKTQGMMNDGQLIINGGKLTVICDEGEYTHGIGNSGTMQVNDGDINISATEAGMQNDGSLSVSGGRINISCESPGNCVANHAKFEINGGSMDLDGSFNNNPYTIYNGYFYINGGSVKMNNSSEIDVTNSDNSKLECVIYDTFPTEAERTFTNSDGTSYIYALTEADKADDGKYYVWKPVSMPEATGVAIDSTNFPDEFFRNYVSENFDTDSDGYLINTEIAAVTEIDVSGTSVNSLQGIEYFTSLTNLHCSETEITSLDISKNTALIQLYCHSTSIDSLDVSNNTALKYLWCYDTEITSLDVSNNTELIHLYCHKTGITALEVSNNINLSILHCYNTGITSLDVSSNTVLTELCCYLTGITALDVSNNTELTRLRCQASALSHIDLYNNTYLTEFTGSNNKYPIPSNAETFDASTIEGFDSTRVSDVSGADYDHGSGLFYNITGDITYIYDCGQGYSETFTLTRTGEAVEKPDRILYTEDGPITITASGYTQGSGSEVAYTENYVISQRDPSTAVNCAISVESGMHTIEMSGVNINCTSSVALRIDSGAYVTLNGGDAANTLVNGTAGSSGGSCVVNMGELSVNGGEFTFISNYSNGIGLNNCETMTLNNSKIHMEGKYSYNGVITINGGSVTAVGGVDSYSGDEIIITGGSLKFTDTDFGSIYSQYRELLECVIYDTFPTEAERTFTNPDDTSYIYALTEADKADDGKYYVWRPVSMAEATGVAIDGTNFPDEVFRNYVSTNFDTDSNGYLSDEEIAAVKTINVSGTSSADGGVTSLKGVEYFETLEYLVCYYNSSLTDIDVSKNDALKSLLCNNTGITSLDASNKAALTSLECYNTKITNLDISNSTALSWLECFNTDITELDISSNTALRDLSFSGTGLMNIDVSNNTALEILKCSNTLITELDLRQNTALRKLYCYGTGITELDLSKNTALTYLDCGSTGITALDVSKNIALTTLYCGSTGITVLDVSKNIALTALYCGPSALAYIDLTNNPNLTSFSASGNKYVIPSNATEFDTSSIAGFDPGKVSDVTGASFDSTTGMFTNITSNISYTYDCGQGYSETFTLTRTGAATTSTGMSVSDEEPEETEDETSDDEVVDDSTPDDDVVDDSTPDDEVVDDGTPDDDVVDDGTPDDDVVDDGTPDDDVVDDGTADDDVVDDSTPDDDVVDDSTPDDEVVDDGTPDNEIPDDSETGEGASDEGSGASETEENSGGETEETPAGII